MSDNTCSICLEPLLAAAPDDSVGAVVPCGHCFHSNCFAQWKANKGSSCKCPNCNKPAKSCMKLFIAPAENVTHTMNDDDDDLSLDSTMSNNTATSDDEAQPSRNREANGQETSSSNENNSNSMDSIVVLDLTETSSEARHTALPPMIDLTSTPPRQSKTSGQSTTGSDRYKAIAKQYKRKFEQKKSQLRKLNQYHQSLLDEHEDLMLELDEIKRDLESHDDMEQHFNAQLDGANLTIGQLERELQECMAQKKSLEKETKTWAIKYVELEKSVGLAVKKASNNNMAEIKQLLDERPKILAENERLTRELAKAKEHLDHLQRSMRRSNHQVDIQVQNMDASTNGQVVNKKRKASALARDLRAMDEVLHFTSDQVHPLEDISQPARATLLSRVGKGDSSMAPSTGNAKSIISPLFKLRGTSILTERSNSTASSRSQTLESTRQRQDSFYAQSHDPSVLVAKLSKPIATSSNLKPRPPDNNDQQRVQRLDQSACPRGAFLNLSRPKNNKIGSSTLLFRHVNK